MSCRRYEEWLALEAGGDLPPEKAAELSSHMSECGNCRRAAEELRASLATLRAFHRSPVAEERLDAARATVLAELRTGRASSAWRRWVTPQWLAPRWAVAGLAMALAVTIAFWNTRSADQDQQEKIVASKPVLPRSQVSFRKSRSSRFPHPMKREIQRESCPSNSLQCRRPFDHVTTKSKNSLFGPPRRYLRSPNPQSPLSHCPIRTAATPKKTRTRSCKWRQATPISPSTGSWAGTENSHAETSNPLDSYRHHHGGPGVVR